MKQLILILTFYSLLYQSIAQSTSGITNLQDTSFTTYSAYVSAKKNFPEIRMVNPATSKQVKEVKQITYAQIKQRKLVLDAFVPVNKIKKRTAILIIYGGGWRSGNRTQHYPMAQRLAALGYVCFTPEYRLSTEALYPAALFDLKAAVKWVKKHANAYQVDTNKITVIGFSAGGELAAMMGATNGMRQFESVEQTGHYTSTVQAVVDIDGTLSFVHPESGEGDDRKKTSAATYWFGYSKLENPALWEAASPLTHAGKHCPPYLFLNSSVARMHAGQTDFIQILNTHHIYAAVQNFDPAPHSFCLFEPWFEPTIVAIDQFLKKVFPNT